MSSSEILCLLSVLEKHYTNTCSFQYIEISLKIYFVVKLLHRSLTAEHDGEIRKAALDTLATAYKNLGMPTIILFPFLYIPRKTYSFL
jgi:hypothetical protein